MNRKVKKLLENNGGNYILPFFWQSGEDEQTLRIYMKAINEANIRAVCVESRPHPDYCGPKWWKDMEIILDEARKRDMKVWILDDSHFPTGFANGAMDAQPDELHRQSIFYREYKCNENETIYISREELEQARTVGVSQRELDDPHLTTDNMTSTFDDDQMLGVYAIYTAANSEEEKDMWLDLSGMIQDGELHWKAPSDGWKVYVLHLTRNAGFHRNYINMMDGASCRVLIDAVYEPHYEHFKEDFGTTIAGFFSDEPELGNGHIYDPYLFLGTDNDFPWSGELGELLKEKLGKDYPAKLVLLWNNEANADETARIRYIYMDCVTRLVAKDFSCQIGEWCRAHGVQYIGHLIEDNTQHAQTGSSLGHYFRGLSGQDMAGLDVVFKQVFPQKEDEVRTEGSLRIGEFYHYMLAKLGNSHAALDPQKKGNAMCEIFGGYGWSEGVRLEKYLADHFLVRGINHFVPHAFSAAEFPNPDCPPHFYAHGNNPQYRHFGELMKYMNRVCELISDGVHLAPTGILYDAEGSWAGNFMESYKVAHQLCDAQIEYDYVPQDVFSEREKWKTTINEGVLKVNTQEYKVFCVPQTQYVTEAFARSVAEMDKAGVKVLFIGGYPEGICDAAADTNVEVLISGMRNCRMISLEETVSQVRAHEGAEISIEPSDDRLRYYHYVHDDGTSVYLLVNEGVKEYSGTIVFNRTERCYLYDAWNNCLEAADYADGRLNICVEPLKSCIVIFDKTADAEETAALMREAVCADGEMVILEQGWKRSLCRSIDYPKFADECEVSLPDSLEEERPMFSGFVRYENTFFAKKSDRIVLEITDAHEGVELFVNEKNLGIQIVPPYRYDISCALMDGENKLRIEVATTLERELSKSPDICGLTYEPEYPTGINGVVKLYV